MATLAGIAAIVRKLTMMGMDSQVAFFWRNFFCLVWMLPLLAMPELMEVGTHGAEHAAPAAHGAESSHTPADDAHGDDAHANDGHGESMSLVDGLPGWQAALVTLAAIAAVIIGGSTVWIQMRANRRISLVTMVRSAVSFCCGLMGHQASLPLPSSSAVEISSGKPVVRWKIFSEVGLLTVTA